jgi:competence protein ComEC
MVFMLLFFGEFPLATFANNLLMLPILLVFFYGMIVSLIISPIIPFLTETINLFLDYLLQYVITIIKFINLLPVIENRGDNLFFILLFFVLIYIFNKSNKKVKRYIAPIFFSITALYVIKLYVNYYWLHVRVFDVGQAQAVLLSNNDKHILFDAGKDLKYRLSKKSVLKNSIERLGLDTIDYLFVSHWDFDHYGDYKNLAVKKKIYYEDKGSFEKVKSIYNIANIVILNDTNAHRFKDENNRSIVSKVHFGKTSFLFTGDIAFKRERQLLGSFPLASTFVMAAHHGSQYSNSEAFIKKVNPDIVIFSVGLRNRYKHPSKEVEKRYIAKKHRTDEESYLHFISNGEQIHKLPRFIAFILFE